MICTHYQREVFPVSPAKQDFFPAETLFVLLSFQWIVCNRRLDFGFSTWKYLPLQRYLSLVKGPCSNDGLCFISSNVPILLGLAECWVVLWCLIISSLSCLFVLSAHTWHSFIHSHWHHARTFVFVDIFEFVYLGYVYSNSIFDLSK